VSFRARREKSFFDLEYDVFKLNHYHAAASIDIDTRRQPWLKWKYFLRMERL